jgi:hypothetical protein
MTHFMIASALIKLADHGKHGSLEVVDLRLLFKTPPREISQNVVGHEFIEVVFEVIVITRLQLGEAQRRRPLFATDRLASGNVLKVLVLPKELQRGWLELV